MFFSPVTMTLVYHLSKILLVDFIDFGLDNVEATFLLFHFFFFFEKCTWPVIWFPIVVCFLVGRYTDV